MPIPTQYEDIRVDLGLPAGAPQRVLDHEVDRQKTRISWNAGGNRNPVVVASVDGDGRLVGTTPVADDSALTTFANHAEWGLVKGSVAGGYTVGLYFNRILNGDAVIMEIDPALPVPSPPSETFLNYPPLQQDPGYDYWLLDGWERLSAPMVLYVKAPVATSYWFGEVTICDLTGTVTGTQGEQRLPNYDMYVSNTRSRAVRVVPEYPAAVQIAYTWPGGVFDPYDPNLLPDAWELRWQEIANPAPFFAFTPQHANQVPVDLVLGVGVERLTHPNANLTFNGEGYFVYVLRRDAGPNDHVDFYVFDYDPAGVAGSTEVLRGTVPVPNLGPGAAFRFIGDDEPYVDPVGNPCIALTLVANPTGNPNNIDGVVCVFEFDFVSLPGAVAQPAHTTFRVLTPATAPAAPRKDPETLTVWDQAGKATVYIFNRQRVGQDWELHRTLAFV